MAGNDLAQLAKLDKELEQKLAQPFAPQNIQLQLFDGFFTQTVQARQNKQKWNWQDEMLAQLLARGYSNLEAYRLSHKDVKTTNPATLYPNASRACNRSKILARVETIRREMEEKALMSTTEYFSILNNIARNPSKDAQTIGALKMIGQIKGLFQADKGSAGSEMAPLVVRFADETAKDTAAKQGGNK